MKWLGHLRGILAKSSQDLSLTKGSLISVINQWSSQNFTRQSFAFYSAHCSCKIASRRELFFKVNKNHIQNNNSPVLRPDYFPTTLSYLLTTNSCSSREQGPRKKNLGITATRRVEDSHCKDRIYRINYCPFTINWKIYLLQHHLTKKV